jgi:hypothetical protein
MNDILFLGRTNFRNQEKKFGIKLPDRRQHAYVIGKSGTGKSTLLLNMIVADIQAGRGVCVIDPHGELAEDVLKSIPEDRADDVIYFNPADLDYPIAFNPLERVNFGLRHLIASGIMSVFKKVWPDAWSARMEYILNNTLLALLEYPTSTLLGIMKMYSDKEYRRRIVDNLQDPVVKSFWVDEFAKYTQKLETEALSAIQNKVGQFISNPLIRNILGQAHSTFDMRRVMDEQKILIINLSKGRIGEDNSALLGTMIITKLQLAAMSRVDIPMEERKDFFLYVDEFQNFATESFANILSEARKYRLSLIVAHQYIAQLDDKVKTAIFGNVGTMVVFRVGADDAQFLEKEFFSEFVANDFVNLPNTHIYIRLMIDGMSSKPFSAKTLPPPLSPVSVFDMILQSSREKYALPREKVEEIIKRDYQSTSQEAAKEMVGRREERSLGEVLKRAEEAMPPRKKEHFKEHEQKVPISELKDIIRKALVKGGEETKPPSVPGQVLPQGIESAQEAVPPQPDNPMPVSEPSPDSGDDLIASSDEGIPVPKEGEDY